MNKKDYTILFLKQAGVEVTEEIIKAAMTKWWATPYSPIGYRLKSTGCQFLISKLELEYFKCDIKPDFQESNKVLLAMNKHLTAPYYLTPRSVAPRTLICFGETDRFMMAMMDGDLGQYLDNFTR